MRRIAAAPPPLPKPTATRVEWKGSIKLLTPLYKGGASPDIADKKQAFRGPSIRGQLRYWWRATSALTDLSKLRNAEQQLFGGVFGEGGVASQVRVGVIDQDSEVVTEEGAFPGSVGPIMKVPFPQTRYLLWVNRDPAAQIFHKTASGKFSLSAPNAHKQEIQNALEAWILCGGLGSRSRRGLGGVWANLEANTNLPQNCFASRDAFLATLKKLVPPGGNRPWPTLSGGQVITGPIATDALSALRLLAKTMQQIRTYHNKQRPIVFDRSWQSVWLGNTNDIGFTAALGMPVPYQSSSKHFTGQRTLQPASTSKRKIDRYPSPILFRAIPLANNKFLPTMIILNTPKLDGVIIKELPQLGPGKFQPSGLQTFLDALPKDWQRTPLSAP